MAGRGLHGGTWWSLADEAGPCACERAGYSAAGLRGEERRGRDLPCRVGPHPTSPRLPASRLGPKLPRHPRLTSARIGKKAFSPTSRRQFVKADKSPPLAGVCVASDLPETESRPTVVRGRFHKWQESEACHRWVAAFKKYACSMINGCLSHKRNSRVPVPLLAQYSHSPHAKAAEKNIQKWRYKGDCNREL